MWWLIRFLLACFFAYVAYFCLFKTKDASQPWGCVALGLAFMLSPGGSMPIIGIIMGFVMIVIGIIWSMVYSSNEKNGVNEQKRIAEQAQIQKEYEEAVDSQFAEEPWAIRYSTSPCPYCRHYKVRHSKWEDKRYSVAFWGAASDKLGKQFKCEHCGEMW